MILESTIEVKHSKKVKHEIYFPIKLKKTGNNDYETVYYFIRENEQPNVFHPFAGLELRIYTGSKQFLMNTRKLTKEEVLEIYSESERINTEVFNEALDQIDAMIHNTLNPK